ncbi:MAG TPA: TolC family protein, partial [Ohtaekwangia sp.]
IPDEATVYQTAKSSNPEYQVLGVREDIGSESIRVASGARKPVVAAVGQYQVVSQTNNLEFNNAHYPGMSYVGLQVSVPLFTGLGNQAKVKQAQAAYQQSTLVRQYSEENLRSVVHEVIARNRESAARLETTRTVLETAQLSYNIIQYRYQSGIASRLELTDAELALSTSQVNYLEAIYDYLTAQIQLNKLMGVAG